jgi:hypothetical protein
MRGSEKENSVIFGFKAQFHSIIYFLMRLCYHFTACRDGGLKMNLDWFWMELSPDGGV